MTFQTGSPLARLRILATTDLHAHLYPYDYYADREAPAYGLARTATLIERMRVQSPNTLLFDNGDFLQGSPLGDFAELTRQNDKDGLHPAIAAMNILDYDAVALGNHEFNYGLDYLSEVLSGARFPVLCANAVRKRAATPQQDVPFCPPHAILNRNLFDEEGLRHQIRIGVIGLLPPQITSWDRACLHGQIETRCMIEMAAALVPELRAAGADLVIVLAHTGISGENPIPGMENAAIPLARIDGVDAVVAGHSHLVFPSPGFNGITDVDADHGTIAGKPAVMPGFWGSHLGVIDLLLNRRNGRWRVQASRSEAIPVAQREENGRIVPLVKNHAGILAAAGPHHRATLNSLRREVAHTQHPLHSYFALVGNSAAVQLVCHAQQAHVCDRLAGTEHAGLAILSAAAPFKAGGRAGPENYTAVAPGGIALRNLVDLYSFPNTICAVRITGAELREWLERSASIFRQVTPGQNDQPLLNPDFPGYNFDIIMGITYEIDLSQPARYDASGVLIRRGKTRIRKLCFQGRPLDRKSEFIVATNNHRVDSSGFLTTHDRSRVIYESTITNREILLRYFQQGHDIDPPPPANWRFTPLNHTSVLFDTSPLAQGHLDDLPDLKPEPVGHSPEGFARFRLHV
ncbi:MAG: bifunctional 2',3'-cyclic-nucleotide 2'-phosphodiesterase/3'-nucleotidase [Pseudorhodobacter sp.]